MTSRPPLNADALALERTVLAAERTLMAWIRTSIAFIGFGFTIFKFLQGLEGTDAFAAGRETRTTGLTLIVMGLIALLLAILQYVTFLRAIGRPPRRFPLLFAAAFLALGILAFVDVLRGG
jgi:putative membrane protein